MAGQIIVGLRAAFVIIAVQPVEIVHHVEKAFLGRWSSFATTVTSTSFTLVMQRAGEVVVVHDPPTVARPMHHGHHVAPQKLAALRADGMVAPVFALLVHLAQAR
jgi:hypothetical protein